jgi:TrmH RNA methyltransferase
MRNKLTDELAVCGYNAVRALGERHPDTINRLFLREDLMHDFGTICKTLAERQRPYKLCDDEELERISKSRGHQGVVAMIYEPDIDEIDEVDIDAWADDGRTGLVLHNITNDHNLGAICRSAAFLDCPICVLSEPSRTMPLTTSAYRVAEGGIEYIAFRYATRTAALVRSLSRRIITIGTDMRARQRLRDLPKITAEYMERAHLKKRPGFAIIMGNEETGLPPAVKDACTALVRVPGTGYVESLNVAQAATLFLEEIYEM